MCLYSLFINVIYLCKKHVLQNVYYIPGVISKGRDEKSRDDP